MIIKIDKTEREVFEGTCACMGLQATFYSIENNDLMLHVEILDRGKEPPTTFAYYLGRDTGMQKLHNSVL